MKDRVSLKSILSSFAVCTLCCTWLTGCDEVINDKSSDEAIVVDADPNTAALNEHLAEIKAAGPEKLNEHTTLHWVKKKGTTRIEFRYRVAESGRESVNAERRLEIRAEILERMKSSKLTESILELNLSVDHVFRDSDNKSLFSTTVTPQDIEDCAKEIELAKKKIEAEAIEAAAEQADLEKAELARVAAEADATQNDPTMPQATTVSNPQDEWLPSKTKVSNRSKVNPAGLRDNPYAEQPSSQQTNPYFQ